MKKTKSYQVHIIYKVPFLVIVDATSVQEAKRLAEIKFEKDECEQWGDKTVMMGGVAEVGY